MPLDGSLFEHIPMDVFFNDCIWFVAAVCICSYVVIGVKRGIQQRITNK